MTAIAAGTRRYPSCQGSESRQETLAQRTDLTNRYPASVPEKIGLATRDRAILPRLKSTCVSMDPRGIYKDVKAST